MEVKVPAKDFMKISDIISGAAIYNRKSLKKEASLNKFTWFKTYSCEFIQIDGSSKTVLIDELKCAMSTLDDNFSLSPAGIRIDFMKYMVTFKDEEKGVV